MKYILDTHILLWARLSPDKLSSSHRSILESSDAEKYISTVTMWEISLKYSLGKLDLGGKTPEEFVSTIYKMGVKWITPTEQQYASYYLLPKNDKHKDPFDRMIIWHAIQSGLILLSSDKKISEYKIHGLHLA